MLWTQGGSKLLPVKLITGVTSLEVKEKDGCTGENNLTEPK